MAYIEYDESGESAQLHRENNRPAVIWYDESGEIELEEWYLNGELIKTQSPAL